MAHYIYGPVPSRRLGSSLGVDLVPMKTCTYDCIYCQLGPDESTLLNRKDYVPVDAVLEEISEFLQTDIRPDYITLSGSGEPTLNSSIGRVIEGIKKISDIPVCLLTNGSLLSLPEVRRQCRGVDLIVPNLDAPDEKTFQKINRPYKSLNFTDIVEGLVEFRKMFDGRMWLELFVIPGINDSSAQLQAFSRLIQRINPDCVHLNTAVRPPAESDVQPASREHLEEIRRELGPKAEIIASFRDSREENHAEVAPEDILNMLRRRPCTVGDLAEGLSANPAVIVKHLQRLQQSKKIEQCYKEARVYYRSPEQS